MRKSIFFTIMLIFLFSCGKKEAPPSPDIFAPDIAGVNFYINNQIKVSFSEKVQEALDSVLLVNDSSENTKNRFFRNNVLFIQYTEPPEKISLFGIKDQANNRKDFKDIKIKGSPIPDTLKPRVERMVFRDTLIVIEFDEIVETCSAQLYPDNIEFNAMTEGRRSKVYFTDSLKAYPLQVVIEGIKDIAGNINAERIEKVFFMEGDTLLNRTLGFTCIAGTVAKIMNEDSVIIRTGQSQLSGNIIITGIAPGIYIIDNGETVFDTIIE